MSFPEQKLIKEIIENYKNDNKISIDNICMNYIKDKKKNTFQKTGYKKINKDDIFSYCAVCLDNLSLDNSSMGYYKRKLRCGHVFHKKCVDIWIQENESCPICRCSI